MSKSNTYEIKTPPQHTNAKILFEDENEAEIGLYGVVFGGKDIVGDSFSKSTEYSLDRAVGAPVHIDHTMETEVLKDGNLYVLEGIKAKVGSVINVTADNVGLYMRLKLEKANQYWEIVKEMVETGQMGASTQSDSRAKIVGGQIEIWPINEVSLTLTPAEPRTTENVTRFKTGPAENVEKISFKRNGEVITLSITSTGENISEKESQEVDNSTTIRPDTEKPELEINQNLKINYEVSEMSEEKKINEIEPKQMSFDFEKAFGGLNENLDDKFKTFEDRLNAIESEPAPSGIVVNAKSSSVLKFPAGDSENASILAWMKTGDGGTFDAASGLKLRGPKLNIKASNDTNMNVGTAADGGNAVPTAHFNQIIARRDEDMHAQRLGVRNIPGSGLTVNVPLDAEADGEFVVTSEQVDAGTNTFDRDAPALGTAAMTLAKYTKKIELTDELQQDEDSNLMAFLSDFIGRGIAKTENNLLYTEILANGTSLKTFAATAAIADGELEDIEANDDLGAYLDDSTVAWVMRNSTLGAIRQISGSDRVYSVESGGGPGTTMGRSLLGYPVLRSNQIAAIATSAKSVVFGNFYYVGRRQSPSMTLLRDPFSTDGVLTLKYYFRSVYKVLQAEAIGYGVQAAA